MIKVAHTNGNNKISTVVQEDAEILEKVTSVTASSSIKIKICIPSEPEID